MAKSNFESVKVLKWIIFVLLGLILLFVFFRLGYEVGRRKAAFSCGWGKNYHQLFGGPRRGFDHNFDRDEFLDANGTAGAVIKIEGDSLIIKGQNNVEKSVVVSNSTVIRRQLDNLKLSDIKVDDNVVVIGSASSSGQIEAKLIRIFPTPPLALPAKPPIPPAPSPITPSLP